MKVEYIDHMGSDLTVVNAARVSFDKHHTEFDLDKDVKLIKYLAKHNHFTPFTHCQITLRLTVPVFVDRQLVRHTVGGTRNEVSRRYVDTDPEFYLPDNLGARAENKKQGSKDGEFIDYIGDYNGISTFHVPVKEFLNSYFEDAFYTYRALLDSGVSPEDARMVLPLSTLTSYYLTGSLSYYHRLYALRTAPEAQRQTREVAEMVSDIIEPLFPISWTALKENFNG